MLYSNDSQIQKNVLTMMTISLNKQTISFCRLVLMASIRGGEFIVFFKGFQPQNLWCASSPFLLSM